MIRIGAVFPQTEIGEDPAAVRDFAQAAEGLGYSHLLAFDHVVGAVPTNREPALWGSYTERSLFHEPLTLFAYLSAVTTEICFATGVLVLPQRQTVLVAKQSAEVAILSAGRLRLGVGVGWNYVEYESLNEDFHTRGARQEEQITVLRKMWTESVVDFTGQFHRIDRGSILPRPLAPIPIWLGGFGERSEDRAARLADGFLFIRARPGSDSVRLSEPTQNLIDRANAIRDRVALNGRDARNFGFEGRINFGDGPHAWVTDVADFRRADFSHVAVNTMEAGLTSPNDHLAALSQFATAVGLRK